MTTTRTVLKQGTQYRGDGFMIGYISTDLRPAHDGGGITARLGISSAEGRTSHTLAEGDATPLPGGGTVRLVSITVDPTGSQTAASIEIDRPERDERDER